MADNESTIELHQLTPLEVADLKQALKETGAEPSKVLVATPERGGVSGTRKGEPATVFIVLAVSQAVLTGVALWVAKGRSQQSVSRELEYRSPTGEVMRYRVESTATTEEAIAADVLEQLKGFTVPSPGPLGGTP